MKLTYKLPSWEQIPDKMRLSAVQPYYDALGKKKGTLTLKRMFDLVLATLLMILLCPLFLILMLSVKLESPGPVFFRQKRVTQLYSYFYILKFRTMIANAESIGPQVTIGSDSRITRVGKYIRKLRLDEIPQLINVWLGEMSFVGTRPEVPRYVSKYTDEMLATLLLPAGVTSDASIHFKDEETLLTSAVDPDEAYVSIILPRKMKYNLQALKDVSLLTDVKTLFKTAIAVAGYSSFEEPQSVISHPAENGTTSETNSDDGKIQ